MKRYHVAILLIFATFSIEGCRRMRSESRKPVEVKTENDFLINRSKEMVQKLTPRTEVELKLDSTEKDFPTDPDVDIKWPNTTDEVGRKMLDAAQKRYESFKDDLLRKQREKDLRDMSDLYVKFYESTDGLLPQRNVDNFRQFVRRNDTADLLLFKLLEEKKVQPVMEADLSAKESQLILHFSDELKGGCHYAEIAKGKTKIGLDKLQPIRNVANMQLMLAVFSTYKEYLAGDERDWDGMKAYFAKNALGSVVEAHKKQEFKLYDPAKIGTKFPLKIAPPLATMKDPDPKKGNLVIFFKSPKDKKPMMNYVLGEMQDFK